MKRYLLFSTTWIAVVFVLMIMTFTFSLAVAEFPPSASSPVQNADENNSEDALQEKTRELLQKDLSQVVYPPFNSPTNPWLNIRRNRTGKERFVKQTWTSIDGKNYRALDTGNQRYLFTKKLPASK